MTHPAWTEGSTLHQVTAGPLYPTWIRSVRITTFWLVAGGIIAAAVITGLVWRPGLAIGLLALPFLYIALVITLSSYRLSPRGDDLQAQIHRLLIERAGSEGRLLDVGCGSGELLVRCAKASPGEYVGLDFWPREWGDYSGKLAQRNARLEGVVGVVFVQGTASNLPFDDERFRRVVSSLTFHEVRDHTDKTASLVEALRVLDHGGRFAFVDLFDDPTHYGSRQRVLDVIRSTGGEVESVDALSDLVKLNWPMNAGKVLAHAVVVQGTKSP